MAFLARLFGGGEPKFSKMDIVTYYKEHYGKDDHVLIDVRTPGEFASGHVPGAKNVPLQTLAQNLDQVPRDQPVMVICRSGSRSGMACNLLAKQGYDNLTNLQGGTMRWRNTGYIVE